MSVHHIHLIGATSDAPATFLAEEVGEECCLICTHGNLSVEGKASDFFEALCLVRLELEKHRLIPFCYGASLNVYPSGMARDMSAGLKAYKLRDGRHARSEDLVEVFEQGPDVIPCSVAMQRKNFDEWVSSARV